MPTGGGASRVKLLMVTHHFEDRLGGIEIVAERLSRGLAQQGAAVTWLASAGDADQTRRAASIERVRRVPVRASAVTERTLGFPYPILSPAAVATIWREVAAADAVILHDSLYMPCVTAFLAAQRHRKPVLIVQHVGLVPYNNPLLRGMMRLANQMLARPLLGRADQAVFVSEITARHFGDVRFQRPPQLIFNGVDTEVFAPATLAAKHEQRHGFGLPADKPVALFVGRFVEKKGLSVLAQLARQCPQITWAFAGRGPEDPKRLGLANVHVFDGLAGESLAKLYQASDALVLPSVGEGFPLVIQEALACGLPVVCSVETAGADAAASHLLTGVAMAATPDETARRFAAAVTPVLLGADERAAQMARRHLTIDRYGWPQALVRYGAVLDAIVAGRSCAPARIESAGAEAGI